MKSIKELLPCNALYFFLIFVFWLLALLFFSVEFELGSQHFSVTLKIHKKVSLIKPAMCPQWSDLELVQPPGIKVGLLSMPGSGSTWTRHVLQSATGLRTGSVYHNDQLLINGFPGENISDGSVAAIKDYMENGVTGIYDKVIVLMRKPVKAALTQFFLELSANSSLSGINLHTFLKENIQWLSFLTNYVEQWRMFYQDVMKVYKPEQMCYLEYESLRFNPYAAITESCFPFLGYDIKFPDCLRSKNSELYKSFTQIGISNELEAELLKEEMPRSLVVNYSRIRSSLEGELKDYIKPRIYNHSSYITI